MSTVASVRRAKINLEFCGRNWGEKFRSLSCETQNQQEASLASTLSSFSEPAAPATNAGRSQILIDAWAVNGVRTGRCRCDSGVASGRVRWTLITHLLLVWFYLGTMEVAKRMRSV